MLFPNTLAKKNIIIITAFVILTCLLIQTVIVLEEVKKEMRISNNIISLTFHKFSIINYESSGTSFDFAELVVGNEDEYCHAVEGYWNNQTRECLNISEKHCRLITGSMNFEEEYSETSNCILK